MCFPGTASVCSFLPFLLVPFPFHPTPHTPPWAYPGVSAGSPGRPHTGPVLRGHPELCLATRSIPEPWTLLWSVAVGTDGGGPAAQGCVSGLSGASSPSGAPPAACLRPQHSQRLKGGAGANCYNLRPQRIIIQLKFY